MQNEYKKVDGYVITSKFLGKGAFGTVHRGYLENDPKVIVAAKQMALSEAHKHKNFLKSVKREIEILQKIESPYIVRLFHAARTANNYYMFLEYCNGGDLRQLLKSRGGVLSEQEALTFFKQIVQGYKAIYQENVIHRDIKPANILLHNGIAKISDFGFARVVDDMEGVDKLTLLGTPLYMSPQILASEKFNSKCDIWSLGMLFYEFLYGQTPWNANSQVALLNQIKKTPLTFPNLPKRSQTIKELIARMLIVDEEKRITWYELFDHELIKFNSKELKEKMNLIIDSVGDLLEQSVQLNQLYINHNKVLAQGKDENNLKLFEIQEMAQENFSPASSDSGMQLEELKGMTYNDIIDKQTKSLQEQDTVNKIDNYLTIERNIGIFVNQATNNAFALYKEGTISIPMHLFYRLIFILQKYQIIIFEELTNIMASKQPLGKGFSEIDWKLYKRSQQYFTTLKAIKTDKYYIKPYYEEITKRTFSYLSNIIEKLPAQDKQEIEEFLSIMAMGLVKDMAFNSIYEKVIVIVIKQMIETINQQKQENRLYLQTIKYLYLCLNPFNYFKDIEHNDFNKFYETYDNIELDQLLKEIQQDLEKYHQ